MMLQAPAALTRTDPYAAFTDVDKKRLLDCIVAHEGIAELE
jgi:hypothetical protein